MTVSASTNAVLQADRDSGPRLESASPGEALNAGNGVLSTLGLVDFRRLPKDEALAIAREIGGSAAMTPFQSAEWLEAVVAGPGQGGSEEPFFAAGYVGDHCLVLMPLAVSRTYGLRTLGWLGQSASDYNCPLVEPELLSAMSPPIARDLWMAAARLAGNVDIVIARKQPATIAGHDNPFAQINARNESDEAHFLRLAGPWETVEAELVSKKGRRRLKEKRRALEKAGRFEIRTVTGQDEIRSCMSALVEWKTEQLNLSGASNPFCDPAYRRLLAAASSGGALEVSAALLDGAPIAVTCVMKNEEAWSLYQTAYAPDHARRSPGRILNLALMKAACEAGIPVFDFGYGSEEYKQSLCDHSMSLTSTLLPLTARGALMARLAGNAITMRAFVKQNPFLRDGALRLKRMAGRVSR